MRYSRRGFVTSLAAALILTAALVMRVPPLSADVGNCAVFPNNNIWNTRIDSLAVHPNSDNFVNHVSANAGLHPDFGTMWNGAPNGIPYRVVPTNQPLVAITLTPYGNQADPGPYPVPTDAIVEGGMSSNGDRHLLLVRQGDCKLFEMYRAFPNADGSWRAYGAKFDLTSNALRPDGWTSADAAGLPMLAGLVKFDEVQAALQADGVIHHALRFTVPQTYEGYVWPARHLTNTSTDPNDPPQGLRFRLKAIFDLSTFSPSNQVILRTLQEYGMFVADNGSPLYLSGAPDARWNDDDLHNLQTGVHGSDFEAVDESGLIVNPDSGEAQQSGFRTATSTSTLTRTRTVAPSSTRTATSTPTRTRTETFAATSTLTRTRTTTHAATRTGTRTATRVVTSTSTRTRIITATRTTTSTLTRTRTSTRVPPTVAPSPTNRNPAPKLGGCNVFPYDSIFNTPIDNLPVDQNSEAYIDSIGADTGMHPDFGAGLWNGAPIGIPYNLVKKNQPLLPVKFQYRDQSDKGPYPIPSNPQIEGGSDRHLLTVQKKKCGLFELFAARQTTAGKWKAGSGAIWNLNSNALRPATWTSADAAGLPIAALLVRHDEVAAGEIRHALRFTASATRAEFIWPARHQASDITDENVPPMGQRFRLKQSFDLSNFSPQTQVILQALKKYGMFLADNGSDWYLNGAPDERWDNDALGSELRQVKGSDFEAVDESGLMVDPDSGQAKQP